MRISDWSSDVCSSDLAAIACRDQRVAHHPVTADALDRRAGEHLAEIRIVERQQIGETRRRQLGTRGEGEVGTRRRRELVPRADRAAIVAAVDARSEEHTSELQSLMRISYAVFCLKKKKETKRK